MKNILLTLLITLFLGPPLLAQTPPNQTASTQTPPDSTRELIYRKDRGVLVGHNFWQNHFVEVGVSIRTWKKTDLSNVVRTFYFSNEFRLGSTLITAQKLGMWRRGDIRPLLIGAALIHYTDFNRSAFALKPEIGFGSKQFKLTYGTHIIPFGDNLLPINTNEVSFAFFIPLKTKRIVFQDEVPKGEKFRPGDKRRKARWQRKLHREIRRYQRRKNR